jgi:phospholipid/cholesterol/gamma-HCH transport system permease protein
MLADARLLLRSAEATEPLAALEEPLAALEGSGWTARDRGGDLVIVLTGDWIARQTGIDGTAVERLLTNGSLGTVSFDATQLGRWDSALIVFLWALRTEAAKLGVAFDQSGLPPSARRLLALASIEVVPEARPTAHEGLPNWVGQRVIAGWSEIVEVLVLVGDTMLRAVPALRGRGGLRPSDVLDCAWEAGIAALPIVTVVNVLVGGILAFVGAVQLRRFGAGIYVSNLVGVAVVREMAAVMTAIIMSGRTGGAYAAHIATMQGNEEIEALRVVGVRVYDYLILPRIAALMCMMPILYLYGCAVGIFGGFVVAVATLDLGFATFLEQTRAAVDGQQFLFGLIKSVIFGGVIAFAGCRVGLRAGRSAADVGRAATTAVVIGIVGVIALDALFAVCANALGI